MQSRFPIGRDITGKSEAGLPKLHRTKTRKKERLGKFRRGKTIPWHIKRGRVIRASTSALPDKRGRNHDRFQIRSCKTFFRDRSSNRTGRLVATASSKYSLFKHLPWRLGDSAWKTNTLESNFYAILQGEMKDCKELRFLRRINSLTCNLGYYCKKKRLRTRDVRKVHYSRTNLGMKTSRTLVAWRVDILSTFWCIQFESGWAPLGRALEYITGHSTFYLDPPEKHACLNCTARWIFSYRNFRLAWT